MENSITCTISNVHNNRMCRTSAVQHEVLVHILSGYCSTAYRTGSPTCSEFTYNIILCAIEINLRIVHIQKLITLHRKAQQKEYKSIILISNKNALWWCINLSFDKMQCMKGWFMLRVNNIPSNNKRKILLLCYHKSRMFLTRQMFCCSVTTIAECFSPEKYSAVVLPQGQNVSYQRNILLSCYHKDRMFLTREIFYCSGTTIADFFFVELELHVLKSVS